MGMTNTYSGVSAYFLSGVNGATQADGEQPAPTNVGGTSGAWTVTLSVDSSSWGAYSGGGTIVDYGGNYALKTARLAALAQSTGAAFVIGEFGPGSSQSDNDGFAMAYSASTYASSADLTLFGQQVVEGCLDGAHRGPRSLRAGRNRCWSTRSASRGGS